MTCDKFSGLFDQYLKGSLDARQAAECERHLETCDECRLLLEIRKDCAQLDDGFEVPESFSTSWRQSIREQEDSSLTDQTKGKRGNILSFSARRWIAIAASVVFVFGGTWLVSQSRPEAPYGASLDNDAGMYKSYARGAGDSAPAAPSGMAMTESAFGQTAGSAPEEFSAAVSDEAVSPQKIVRTVSLSLSTRSFEEDLTKLNTALADQNGYVEYSDIAADRGSLRYASMTLRIPKDNLDAYLRQVTGVGQTVSITESREDVSERYSDTATRLQTQTTKMERLLDLLSKASLVEDILAIEREIADTQYQIDSLTGSLQGMDSKVDYSTVQLYIAEEVLSPSADQLSLTERIRLAVSDAWMITLKFLENFVILLSVSLPYLALLTILVLITKTIIRRKKK